jgi:hypothetical protein
VATDILLTGWLRPLPNAVEGLNMTAAIDNAKGSINLDEPQFQLRLGSLGASLQLAAYLNPSGNLPQIDSRPVLYFFATYCDIFKNQHPRAPRAEWQPGHFVIQEWN